MSEDLDTKVEKALSWFCTEALENNFFYNGKGFDKARLFLCNETFIEI